MKRLLILAALAGCAHTSGPTTYEGHGEGSNFVVGPGHITGRLPASTPTHRAVPKASRSRTKGVAKVVTGSPLTSTAFCETGLMANGRHVHRGAVAANRYPLGTRVRVSNSPYGPGVFTVEDRYGHGTELDFAMPGDCAGADRWGRRAVHVEVVR